jgi:hypothetical protein
MIARTTRGQFLALLLALPAFAAGAAPRSDPDAQVRRMLEALKGKSYEGFLTDADDKFRSALTKPQFDGVAGMLAPRLQQGYRIFYLAKLRQQGFETHLWKLECADGKDEHLVKMSVKEGKVGGFFVQ